MFPEAEFRGTHLLFRLFARFLPLSSAPPLAIPPPPPSRIFILIFSLMASRRLNSDRFFTTDFNARIYTQTGLDWIADNDMSTVLLRHFPDLLPALRNTTNAFAP